jgi:phosphotransferase system enzyme I (PtsI)
VIVLKGIAASAGIADGIAFRYQPPQLVVPEVSSVEPERECIRLRDAAAAAVEELVGLKERVRLRQGDEFAHIFRSQQTIAEDESILQEAADLVTQDGLSAEAALRQVFAEYISMFAELPDDDYNKARGADIEDVYKRIFRILLGHPSADLSDLKEGTVIVAAELLPSDTALMDIDKVAAMITETGGSTSHVAILANNLGLPAMVGVHGAMSRIGDGDRLLVSVPSTGEALAYVNPEKGTRTRIMLEKEAADRRSELIKNERDLPSITSDGRAITLSANLGSTAELAPAREAGAGSIGLYRSEFLYLNSPSLPTEDEQFAAYDRAAREFEDGFVIIRTLDIGGDKQLPALPLPVEDNPFLGKRALRLTLDRPDLFLTQLRAILRASARGNIKIMFPMVSGVPELDAALELLQRARRELSEEGIPYDNSMEIGIMIEIPSAIWCADALAKRVSFFSVGTNDLTQYLLAADRMNPDLIDYYRSFDPALFRAIGSLVCSAEQGGCWVGICGELGGNPLAIPVLIGLGVTELSMSPRSLAEAGWVIRRTDMGRAGILARKVLDSETDEEIRAILREEYDSKEQTDT